MTKARSKRCVLSSIFIVNLCNFISKWLDFSDKGELSPEGYVSQAIVHKLHCGTLKNPHTSHKRVGHRVPGFVGWPSVVPSYTRVGLCG